jgi:lipid A ethanolaminephosphotransferase
VLAAQIAALRAAGDRLDAALLYVSDHGESLGERGLYLHGMPYNFAPRVQKEVPMLFWMSPSLQQRSGVTVGCLRAAAARPGNGHDQVFHTVFGLMSVRNAVYREERDLTASCRSGAAPDLVTVRARTSAGPQPSPRS